MFGRSMINDMMGNDPFFRHHQSMMSEMDRMMSDFHRSFGGMPAIGDNTFGNSGMHGQQSNEMIPFGFGGGSMMMRSMFDDMDGMMAQMQRNGGGAQHSFSSTRVMSYTNDGSGQPKYYEATSETTQGPNGVRQTRKSERDSQTGLDRMAIGHHIYDRGHVVERSRNRRTNEREEKEEFINMDESDKDLFTREWQEKTRHNRGALGMSDHRRRGQQRAIDSAEYHRDNLERDRQRHRYQHQRVHRDSDRRHRGNDDDKHVRLNSRAEEI